MATAWGSGRTSSSATAGASDNWYRLSGVWYSKEQLWDMNWQGGAAEPTHHGKQHDDLFVLSVTAAAPYGGPIATVRDEKVFQPARGALQAELEIFTAKGTRLGSTPWPWTGLITMEWAANEVLVAVFQDGVVRTFSPFCKRLHFFTMDERLKSEGGVIKCIIRNEVIIAVSGAIKIYANFSMTGAACLRLADCGMRSPPVSLEVIPSPLAADADPADGGVPNSSASGGGTKLPSSTKVKVLVAAETGHLLLVDSFGSIDLMVQGGPFCCLSVSPSGNFVACLSTSGVFKVFMTNDFSRPVEVANLEVRRKARQMLWVGEDCVSVYVPLSTPSGATQHMVFVGGPESEWLPFQYSNSLFLVSEVDGVRILSPSAAEFVSRVPPSAEAIYSIGSCDAPALLCYALEQFDAGNVQAEESLRSIQNDLRVAAAACLDAALHEMNSSRLAQLLRAHLFGRHFMNLRAASSAAEQEANLDFVSACRDLRVIQALRESPTEIPMTVAQLRSLGYNKLLAKLARCRCHLLATRICHYVGISPSAVVRDWCTERIQTAAQNEDLTDEELGRKVVAKLSKCPDVSFADVAYTAAQAGRPKLATLLLKYESCGQAQVMLLIKLADVHPATAKALAVADPDLIQKCIDSILAQEQHTADGRRDLTVLVSVLQEHPAAEDYFRCFCRDTGNLELLQRYYEQSGRTQEAGWVTVNRAYVSCLGVPSNDIESVKRNLAFAAGFFGSHGKRKILSSAVQSSVQFAHRATFEQIELLTAQRELETKAVAANWSGSTNFVGTPLFATILMLLERGELSEATKLKKRFCLPEASWLQARIESLANTGRFDELMNLVNSKFPPSVGLEPFLAACSRNLSHPNAVEAAATIIPRLPGHHQAYWIERLRIDPRSLAVQETPAMSAGGLSLSSLASEASSSAGGFIQSIAGAFTGKH